MKILVAVDKSQESLKALQYACHFVEHVDSRIDAVYVKPDRFDIGSDTLYAPFVGQQEMKEWIEKETDAVTEDVLGSCEVCENRRIPCSPEILTGDPADEILNLAQTRQYDMIVLGSQGQSALKGLILGAVHSKILHHARQPVLIVRNFRPVQRVLIAYRGSACDQEALEFIGKILQKRKPEITVLHVQESERGENQSAAQACLMAADEKLKSFDLTPATQMATGNFTDEIVKEVATARYDLIVLGAYGHNRPKYLSLISDEALNIARLTTRPVLVFRGRDGL
ncbi:MAG: universal stress protein [Desulfatirhabdiaceae bacterium]